MSRVKRLSGLLFPVALFVATPYATAASKDILVFAAASLTQPLQSIIDDAQSIAPDGPHIRVSFASSSTLAQQIARGAPADIYISANPAWMTFLSEKGFLAPTTRFNLVGNRLVIVVPVIEPFTGTTNIALQDVKDWRLAVGDPDHVPAGQYARSALQSAGLWNIMRKKLIRSSNVRAALALVERGEVRGGIVYQSDATHNPRVNIAYRFSTKTHDPIIYPAAIVVGRNRPEVNRFFSQLRSPSARAIFQHHGFDVSQSNVRPDGP